MKIFIKVKLRRGSFCAWKILRRLYIVFGFQTCDRSVTRRPLSGFCFRQLCQIRRKVILRCLLLHPASCDCHLSFTSYIPWIFGPLFCREHGDFIAQCSLGGGCLKKQNGLCAEATQRPPPCMTSHYIWSLWRLWNNPTLAKTICVPWW